jgi:hypothetical protein
VLLGQSLCPFLEYTWQDLGVFALAQNVRLGTTNCEHNHGCCGVFKSPSLFGNPYRASRDAGEQFSSQKRELGKTLGSSLDISELPQRAVRGTECVRSSDVVRSSPLRPLFEAIEDSSPH